MIHSHTGRACGSMVAMKVVKKIPYPLGMREGDVLYTIGVPEDAFPHVPDGWRWNSDLERWEKLITAKDIDASER